MQNIVVKHLEKLAKLFAVETHFRNFIYHKHAKHTLTYLLTYLLAPWSRVLLEKLTGYAASQEIPWIFGTQKFITVFTSACHLSLSWANSIQFPQPPPTSWRFILILSSHLCLGLLSGAKHTQYISFTFCKIQMILCFLSRLYFQYENLPACVSKLKAATSDIHCKMYIVTIC